jgi:hypothetical protein
VLWGAETGETVEISCLVFTAVGCIRFAIASRRDTASAGWCFQRHRAAVGRGANTETNEAPLTRAAVAGELGPQAQTVPIEPNEEKLKANAAAAFAMIL